MPSARRAAMKARTSCGVELGELASATACRRDARPGRRGTGGRRAHRPRPSWATCAARRRDGRASAPPRPRRRRRRTATAGLRLRGRPSTRHHATGFLHPSLTARNRPDCRPWPQRIRRCPGAGRARPGLFLSGAGGLELAPGDVVGVPLGAREAIGVVWARDVTIQPGLHNRLKDVEDKLDVPPLKPELRKFVDWVSDYTLAPRGMVLRMALRMGEHLGPGAREGRRAARRSAAEAHDGGAHARAGSCWPTAWCARRARPRRRPACRPA